ncbi:MAG: hypothetical protein A3B68_09180 [Candidatus Melainabacteria bacterium RIFCSPHIGHO2_02_FULL_34_12]|nr:MAG: hypothetical protein A3B68_09180 [Candidatus Melainabacteria bacterium RIFCSPHIGHO2_02_FULL_34_12]
MPETPYCPLLSINKEVPVLCQEELCMWYVKQLKLCSITVQAYANALNLQMPQRPTGSQGETKPTQQATPQQQVKQNLTKPQSKDQPKAANPFALDDLD